MTWFRRLSTRGRTILVGLVITIALLVVGSTVPIPYVAVGPGVTFNTIGKVNGQNVIRFTGEGIPASVKDPSDGHLNMTTISITDRIPMFWALGLWASGGQGIAPREDYFPPGQTVEQVNQQNAEMFTDSQSSAEIAALSYLNYPTVVYVGTIPAGSASKGILDPRDRFVAIDGHRVADFASLQKALAPTHPGQVVNVEVLRDGKDLEKKITLGANPQIGKQGALGVEAVQRPVAPFSIEIGFKNTEIGGPSAGMMFALGIIDKLTTGELTGGRFIAGTGTIDAAGNVGPIGGITLKMRGARNAGATVFLAPAANCEEARTDIPAGLELVKVATLSGAMTALDTLDHGGTPPGC